MIPMNELVAASWKIFKVSAALARSALEAAGRQEYELEEAKRIVEEYAARPVGKD